MPRFRGSSPLILRISDGSKSSHRVFHDLRAALQSARTFAETGAEVYLLAPTGQVVMTLTRAGQSAG